MVKLGSAWGAVSEHKRRVEWEKYPEQVHFPLIGGFPTYSHPSTENPK